MTDGPPADDDRAANRKPRARHSPLSVVALFFSVVEAGLAYSAGVSTGGLRVFVVIFMCLFGAAIAATFFVFLWKRNWVFYPPSDFDGATLGDYVRMMRGDGERITTALAPAISNAFSDASVAERLEQAKITPETQTAVVSVLRGIQRDVVDNVGATVVRFDARPMQGDLGARWEELYDADMPAWRFLDRVWLRLQPFPPAPYGSVWLLRDTASGRVFDDIGPLHRVGAAGWKDSRPIGQLGFKGGMGLEVVPNAHDRAT